MPAIGGGQRISDRKVRRAFRNGSMFGDLQVWDARSDGNSVIWYRVGRADDIVVVGDGLGGYYLESDGWRLSGGQRAKIPGKNIIAIGHNTAASGHP